MGDGASLCPNCNNLASGGVHRECVVNLKAEVERLKANDDWLRKELHQATKSLQGKHEKLKDVNLQNGELKSDLAKIHAYLKHPKMDGSNGAKAMDIAYKYREEPMKCADSRSCACPRSKDAPIIHGRECRFYTGTECA